MELEKKTMDFLKEIEKLWQNPPEYYAYL
jgi:hypothetical protein